ncbi:MAG: (2Fe-2S)-binding protein [Bryobacterales bacterium]|nr:(2Fe-2S)-binding protein [Bryobacterales bacterium]
MKKPKRDAGHTAGLSRRRFMDSVAILAATTTTGEAATQTAATTTETATVKTVLNVNGRSHALQVEPRWTLQYVLRDQLGLTGTKCGCERGECGSCTVLVNGVARYSCMTLAVEAEGAEITTIEGLMHGEELGPVQQAFVEEDAFQCGYCAPGQVMSVEAMLRKTPDPSMEQIQEGVSGNLCRCGAYAHIFKAAQRAATYRKS